jgi:hypothetical protein
MRRKEYVEDSFGALNLPAVNALEILRRFAEPDIPESD